MKQYLEMARQVLEHGEKRPDRTGTGTTSLFGYQTRYNLNEGFPCVTTKKLHLRSILHELLWFLKGDTNTKYLNDNNVRIWDEWADSEGNLGPIYGKQWRSWTDHKGETVDQIAKVIQSLKTTPYSRRHIVNAWNVADLDQMALPPCHLLFQFYVHASEGHPSSLSCQLYQRSADLMLGVPFNIASYSLLTMIIAQVCGYQPGEFIHTIGDLHLYNTHEEQMKEQLSRPPYPLPTMKINPERTCIEDFHYEDFTLSNYTSHPAIKANVAI